MKKVFAVAGMVVLMGLGMGLTSMSEAPSEAPAAEQTTGVLLQGTITATGACARLLTCDGTEVVGLKLLPASYSVGDQVELKGQLCTSPSFCSATNRVVKIGRIRLAPC